MPKFEVQVGYYVTLHGSKLVEVEADDFDRAINEAQNSVSDIDGFNTVCEYFSQGVSGTVEIDFDDPDVYAHEID